MKTGWPETQQECRCLTRRVDGEATRRAWLLLKAAVYGPLVGLGLLCALALVVAWRLLGR